MRVATVKPLAEAAQHPCFAGASVSDWVGRGLGGAERGPTHGLVSSRCRVPSSFGSLAAVVGRLSVPAGSDAGIGKRALPPRARASRDDLGGTTLEPWGREPSSLLR